MQSMALNASSFANEEIVMITPDDLEVVAALLNIAVKSDTLIGSELTLATNLYKKISNFSAEGIRLSNKNNYDPLPKGLSLIDICNRLRLETDKYTHHAYCDAFYEDALSQYRDQEIQLLEIGISRGASMSLWAEYFTNAKIMGVDIAPNEQWAQYISPYDNVTVSVGNAYTAQRAAALPDADIIIDDGPHDLHTQISAINFYLPKVKPGGIFIIEDVRTPVYFRALSDAVPEHLQPYIECVDLRQILNRPDDLLFVVRVPSAEAKTAAKKGRKTKKSGD